MRDILPHIYVNTHIQAWRKQNEDAQVFGVLKNVVMLRPGSLLPCRVVGDFTVPDCALPINQLPL